MMKSHHSRQRQLYFYRGCVHLDSLFYVSVLSKINNHQIICRKNRMSKSQHGKWMVVIDGKQRIFRRKDERYDVLEFQQYAYTKNQTDKVSKLIRSNLTVNHLHLLKQNLFLYQLMICTHNFLQMYWSNFRLKNYLEKTIHFDFFLFKNYIFEWC